MDKENTIVVDASKILYLEHTTVFHIVIDFLKNLDTDNLDNTYHKLIENAPIKELSHIFDILTRVFYYVSFLLNSKHPNNCSFKIIKHYISKKKVLLKIKYKEL